MTISRAHTFAKTPQKQKSKNLILEEIETPDHAPLWVVLKTLNISFCGGFSLLALSSPQPITCTVSFLSHVNKNIIHSYTLHYPSKNSWTFIHNFLRWCLKTPYVSMLEKWKMDPRSRDAYRKRPILLDHSCVSIPLERSYAVHSGAFLREQKYYLITNSYFWQNTGEQKHTLYSLQPTIAHNEYFFSQFRQYSGTKSIATN